MYLLYLCTNVTTVPNRYIVLFADIEIQIGQHELSDDEKEFIINVLYFGMDPENSQSDLAPTFDMQFTPSHSNQPRSLFDTAPGNLTLNEKRQLVPLLHKLTNFHQPIFEEDLGKDLEVIIEKWVG